MKVSSSAHSEAVVTLTRGEVLALRNLLERAELIPHELRGPMPMFQALLADFQPLAAAMGSE